MSGRVTSHHVSESVESKSPVELDISGPVATLTLNRPEKRNALNDDVVKAVRTLLSELDVRPSVHVVALRGAGKDFCAGADLAEVAAMAESGLDEALAHANSLGDLFLQMRTFSKPIVAAVRGRALAGGAGLAIACDMVVADDEAEFGFPEIHLGFVPAMVMALLRRKVSESQAFQLAVVGDRISATRARDLGLVNRVFSEADFDGETESLLHEIASRPPGAVALTKRLLYGIDQVSFEAGIRRGAEVNALARTREECRTGIRNFLSRSKD